MQAIPRVVDGFSAAPPIFFVHPVLLPKEALMPSQFNHPLPFLLLFPLERFCLLLCMTLIS